MNHAHKTAPCRIAIIGGGPAGLMAAETLARANHPGMTIDLFDAMPSIARKFLLAGKGGLNLTHSEPFDTFLQRYDTAREHLAPLLTAFGPAQLRDWAHGLGIDTFVGSSGRVFPKEMKAAPLLRAWQQRLRHAGVRFHVRHRWTGWADPGSVDAPPCHNLRFETAQGTRLIQADAVILALGGGSWAKLGSDGRWVPLLEARKIAVAPLRPANCGFAVEGGWSTHFCERHAGSPIKSVALHDPVNTDSIQGKRGEFTITTHGIEGSLIYALSAGLRDALTRRGEVTLCIDLLPDHSAERVRTEVTRPRGARSLSSHLQSRLGLKGVKTGLLRECLTAEAWNDPQRLATAIKALPLRLSTPRPLDEAISSAGGVCFDALNEQLMLRGQPGIFCAGEMLDWEAPTGGYLLTACFSTGHAAAMGVLHWLLAQSIKR
ncbi:MAG: TIGR03862 family flavoprotein [Sterolibacterium sp.]|jgi:uncharacterized flavoprotein (TIGR03862 family)|nr:TIGR03862 family flavoprotein [Sterolibacterium sp.]